MRKTLFSDGVLESTHDVILTEDIVKYLRTVFACENLITHGSKIRCDGRKQKHHCREICQVAGLPYKLDSHHPADVPPTHLVHRLTYSDDVTIVCETVH
jgi:hypothetical protein